ncbi:MULTISPECIES: IucA/IucC family protein [unclassified Kitasatospora]|uniref:IucA/IucC family protein n=1 Tax=unclassified Kitasatospora TaxID=2633591 RepID=UPI00070F0973|nr:MULTISPECIES: IucA/IucC family protein [unclassified Kitasatospora]KQV04577.1 siderophore biosynthesis protein [Kitasatospora sp. Root107]KRB60896.1 siderophore biosynthesis protein [Kitasatospora sp. Root187]
MSVDRSGQAEQLTLRVLGALLREDVLGLRTQSTVEERPDGRWLVAGTLALPVVTDGFQSELTARLPLLTVEDQQVTELPEMLAHLAELADPQDRDGYPAFAEECRQTLATMELHADIQGQVHDLLALRHGEHPADWTGLAGSLGFDTLAAFLDHPVYPTARGRSGLSQDELRSYAPEFHPSFELNWLAVPAGALAVDTIGPRPDWWPSLAQLGLNELTDTHLAVPVHPLSAREALAAVPGAVLAERGHLEVVPTLSMRTVALAEHPEWHLKLPLTTATLGLRNRRTIKPGTLEDGAAGQRLFEAVLAREPRLAERILHADEQGYAHTGHELLAVLVRRYPAGLEHALTVPLAALLAPAPGGLVVDLLADRFYDGSVTTFYRELLALLLDWQGTLFGYGIALESHQQNTSLVLDLVDGTTRLRLLYKDNDGPRVNTDRIGELGSFVGEFDDARVFSQNDLALTDLFTTITGHLCTASLAFGLAAHGRAPLAELLGLLRAELERSIGRLGPAGDSLRAALLDAERLPVKAMVTAGSLLSKERSGAADINKHYTSGPNYLRLEV